MNFQFSAFAIAAALSAPASASVPACSWAAPGARAYAGDVPAAVDSYTDIPLDVRVKLKARMAARTYDDLVEITKGGIAGRFQYAPAMIDMHFRGGVCRGVVDRSAWSQDAVERALVYCEGTHCLAVPTVCRNVSRVIKRPTSSIEAVPRSTRPAPEPLEAQPRTVPEPGTLWLAVGALAAACWLRRRPPRPGSE